MSLSSPDAWRPKEALVSSVNNQEEFAELSRGCSWVQLELLLHFYLTALRACGAESRRAQRDHLALQHLQSQSQVSCCSATCRKCLSDGRKGKENCSCLPSIATQLGFEGSGL